MARPSWDLTVDERGAIVVAVSSVFRKLENLYTEIGPTFTRYGFTPPSAGVVARDLSEKIEIAIVQHCRSFTRGRGYCDLQRADQDWEVKIGQHSGLTINQSKVITGENYLVANYDPPAKLTRIWVLWGARDQFFSARYPTSNARRLTAALARDQIDVIYTAASGPTPATRGAPDVTDPQRPRA